MAVLKLYTTRPQREDFCTVGTQSGHTQFSSSHMGTVRQSSPGCLWKMTAQHTHEDAAGILESPHAYPRFSVVCSRPRPLTDDVFFDVLPGLSLSALISSLLYRTLDT